MRLTLSLCTLAWIGLAGAALAQQGAPPPPPALMDSGTHGEVEILCGTRSPLREQRPRSKTLWDFSASRRLCGQYMARLYQV
jgi:hypothetical protein